ncbi:MAG: type I restriction endonuclease [Pirellulaceae bacterium]
MRELKITGLRAPSYNRRADLVCFVNGLPLVFIELKAVYKNIRAGFDGNLRDYLRRKCDRPCVPPQRLPNRQQRPSRPLRLDQQPMGALL